MGIAQHLALVFSYSYESENDEFIGRLAGSSIAAISDVQFKGAPLSKLRPPDQFPRSYARAKRVVSEPALYRGEGLVYGAMNKKFFGERIVMPLSDKGTIGNGIFGASDSRPMPEYMASVNSVGETEHWFSLSR